MIIGERFVWGHLVKTGGDSTARLFQLFPALVVHCDSANDNHKHDPFGARPEEVRGKALVLNIRRLPSWVLSYAHHVAQFGGYPDYRPIALAKGLKVLAEQNIADLHLDDMTSRNQYPVDRWLRLEHLKSDFLDFVQTQIRVSVWKRARISLARKRNIQRYRSDVSYWFDGEAIKTMYEANPRWASVERKVYGDLWSS
ncbi:MAG: hypothetical protein WAO20_18890 [Acidobacteriota bacterium]